MSALDSAALNAAVLPLSRYARGLPAVLHQHRPTIAQPALKAAMLSQHSADNLLGTELARPAICLDQAQGQLGRCGLGSVDFVDVGREAVRNSRRFPAKPADIRGCHFNNLHCGRICGALSRAT
ncbi:hypothetical protein J4732_15300, partial [Serratia marcescens]|nr:hypothetical protein [Serratia marcescens]